MTKHSTGLLSIILIILSACFLYAQNSDISPVGINYNIKDFGSTGDGVTPDTYIIQDAVEMISEKGGGQLYFPPGDYLIGTIYLPDNITLNVGEGARIVGLPYDHPDYSRKGERVGSMILADKVKNVAIIGRGIIDGGGVSSGCSTPGCASKAIIFQKCKHVLVKDVTILKGGQTALELGGSHDVTISSILMDTNRDGIHVNGTNIRISDVVLNSDEDDVLVFKSGNTINNASLTSFVTITNSYVSGFKPGSVYDGTYKAGGGIGRIKFGTESSAGFSNITINNVIFDKCTGFHMSVVDGGILENIVISNIVMRDVANSPIFIRLGKRSPSRAPKCPPPGIIRNIMFDNLLATSANSVYSSIISGIPGHYIENISLNNIQITYTGGGTKDMADLVPPENEGLYPGPGNFGKLPAYGFYVRHAKGIRFNNVVLDYEQPDFRPAFVFNDVQDLYIHGAKIARASSDVPPIKFRGNIQDVQIIDTPSVSIVPFDVNDIRLSKNKVNAGESFSVFASVDCIEEGLAKVQLYLGENLNKTKYSWIKPGLENEIEFNDIQLYQAGKSTFQIGSRKTSIKVAPAPADLIVSNIESWSPSVEDIVAGSMLKSSVVTAQEPSLIRVTVQNKGSQASTKEYKLKINNEIVDAFSVKLNGGETKDFQFKHIFPTSGKYVIIVNEFETDIYAWNKSGEFMVDGIISIPSTPIAGEPFKIEMKVSDTEYRFGAKVCLYKDDKQIKNKVVFAGNDEEKLVKLDVPPQTAGKHNFSIRNANGKVHKSFNINIQERPELVNLMVNKKNVLVNEQFQTSARIKNKYSVEACLTLDLVVDGETIESKVLTVPAESEKEISFDLKLYKLGKHNISIDKMDPIIVRVQKGSTGNDLEYSDISINRNMLQPGESVEISCKVKNITYQEKTVNIPLNVNNQTLQDKILKLFPGQTREIVFRHQFDQKGEFNLNISDQESILVQVGLNEIPAIFKDKSGNGHFAKVECNPVWCEGKFGKGVQFFWPDDWANRSPQEYSRLEASIGPNDLGPVATVSMWYKPNWDYLDRESFKQAIIENHAGFTMFEAAKIETERMCHLMWGDEGEFISFNMEDEAGRGYEAPDDEATNNGLSELNNFRKDQWYHIAVTWNFTIQPYGVALFVNGEEIARTHHEGQEFSEYENFTFGAHRHNYQAIGSANGVLDEIRAYNRELDKSEIKMLYEGKSVENGLFYYLPLDE